jgi:hypothetical protein
MGFVLAIGIPGIKWDISVDPQAFGGRVPSTAPRQCSTLPPAAGCWRGTLYTSNTEDGRKEGGGLLMQIQIYFLVAFATIIIKGLLSMHSLLENPFGTHPCKFPLRAYNIDHIRQTRAFLRSPEEREPPTVRTIFVSKLGAGLQGRLEAAAAAPPVPSGEAERPQDDNGTPRHIHFVQGHGQNKEDQMHTDVQAPTIHASI